MHKGSKVWNWFLKRIWSILGIVLQYNGDTVIYEWRCGWLQVLPTAWERLSLAWKCMYSWIRGSDKYEHVFRRFSLLSLYYFLCFDCDSKSHSQSLLSALSLSVFSLSYFFFLILPILSSSLRFSLLFLGFSKCHLYLPFSICISIFHSLFRALSLSISLCLSFQIFLPLTHQST